MPSDDDATALYVVVINEEEQYSIWPFFKDVPAGWRVVGDPRPKEACVDEIERSWVDMRPRSLRMRMDTTTS